MFSDLSHHDPTSTRYRRLPNPTANTGDNQVGQPLLLGLAKCQGCGTPMTMLDGDTERPPRYVCPSAEGPDENACDTREVKTGRLDEPVLEHLIVDVLTDDLLQDVIAQVRRNAAQQALRQQQQLESIQGEIERLDHERAKLAAEVEKGKATYAKVAARLARTGDGWRTKQDEARQADHALRGYGYVADDEDRIESYARNPETYLRDMNAATTKSILELIVREVLVSADLVNIAYRLSLRMGTGVGKTHSVIPL